MNTRPLQEADAESLWRAVEMSRELLKRRFNWPTAVAKASDEQEFLRGAVRDAAEGRAVHHVVLDNGAVIGVTSLLDISKLDETARLALWIRTDVHGKGIGTEAAKAAIAEAFGRLELKRIYIFIDPANRAVRRILQKLNFKYEGCMRDHKKVNGRWVNQECWGLLKAEWKK